MHDFEPLSHWKMMYNSQVRSRWIVVLDPLSSNCIDPGAARQLSAVRFSPRQTYAGMQYLDPGSTTAHVGQNFANTTHCHYKTDYGT